MIRTFWKEGFKAEREEDILSAMLNMHMGERQYPGDYTSSEYWPGTAPGKFGPMNAMSPKYNQTVLPELLEIKTIPPLLWIQGTDDHIISNQSFSDPGFQGKLGLKEGWPGQDKFPPQLFVKQIQYSLQKYEKNGGRIQKKYIENCGHTAFIEKPEITRKAILSHFKSHSEAG
jgi:pimeloyl-ACP methyl ester carboxylesterase